MAIERNEQVQIFRFKNTDDGPPIEEIQQDINIWVDNRNDGLDSDEKVKIIRLDFSYQYQNPVDPEDIEMYSLAYLTYRIVKYYSDQSDSLDQMLTNINSTLSTINSTLSTKLQNIADAINNP